MKDFITITEALKTGLIPKSYEDVFMPVSTCECGADVVINEARTIMKCSNPNCYKVLAGRIVNLYKRFDSNGIGNVVAEQYIKENEIRNIVDALKRPPEQIADKVIQWVIQPHRSAEILQMMQLPGMGVTCEKLMEEYPSWNDFTMIVIFNGLNYYFLENKVEVSMGFLRALYKCMCNSAKNPFDTLKSIVKAQLNHELLFNSWDELYLYARDAGLEIICINAIPGSGKAAEGVKDTLLTFWDDITEMYQFCKCDDRPVQVHPIVITGDILRVRKPDGGMFERQEFIDYLNTFSRRSGIVYRDSHALKGTEFIVADTPSNTAKYRAGLESGKLITSDALLQMYREGIESEQ